VPAPLNRTAAARAGRRDAFRTHELFEPETEIMSRLTTETFGRVMVIHTPDELVAETVPALLDTLQSALDNQQVQLVLEMDRTDQYDSEGLNALLDLQDKLRAHGGGVKVSALGETGRKIFEVTRLNQQFDVFESVIDAVSSFR